MDRILVIEDDPTLLETLEHNYYEWSADGLFVVTGLPVSSVSVGETHSG